MLGLVAIVWLLLPTRTWGHKVINYCVFPCFFLQPQSRVLHKRGEPSKLLSCQWIWTWPAPPRETNSWPCQTIPLEHWRINQINCGGKHPSSQADGLWKILACRGFEKEVHYMQCPLVASSHRQTISWKIASSFHHCASLRPPSGSCLCPSLEVLFPHGNYWILLLCVQMAWCVRQQLQQFCNLGGGV